MAPERLPELMDDPECDRDALKQALELLGRTNRRAGTTRLLAGRAAQALSDGPSPTVSVLDVGAGLGDLGLEVGHRLDRRDSTPLVVLSDLHGGTLEIARERVAGLDGGAPGRTQYVRLSAPELPFADRSFDFAVSSTVLHHLEEAEAIHFIRELSRVTRRGWAIVDLRRSRAAYAAVRLLAATVWRNSRLPRHDGPVSVRRAFSLEEARQLVRAAGARGGSVSRLRPFRLLIEGRGRGR